MGQHYGLLIDWQEKKDYNQGGIATLSNIFNNFVKHVFYRNNCRHVVFINVLCKHNPI